MQCGAHNTLIRSSSRSTSQLGTLWDAIALTDAQSDVLKALQLISPEIEAVSMIGGSDSRMRSRNWRLSKVGNLIRPFLCVHLGII